MLFSETVQLISMKFNVGRLHSKLWDEFNFEGLGGLGLILGMEGFFFLHHAQTGRWALPASYPMYTEG
jgi:hypothetical protein